jgi:hypothetical protein
MRVTLSLKGYYWILTGLNYVMKEKIKIKFTDFWSSFDIRRSYMYRFLNKYFDVELSENPDFLIYSVWGNEYLNYDCIRIFHTMENEVPDFNECDFAFSFEYNSYGGRNYRLPNYVAYGEMAELTKEKNIEEIIREKVRFCNMVVSNPKAKRRIEFFHRLSKYKKVDSGGKYLNNVGGPVHLKSEFIRKYKFTLAFENESHSGYTTEKLLEPFQENSIAIYWGNPSVGTDFNTKSFLNFHDYGNDKELIERIIEVDNNEELYRKILSEPYFNDNLINTFVNEKSILSQWSVIVNSKDNIIPVAKTWRRNLINKRRIIHRLKDFKRKWFN